jgi:hypothetical protein
MAELGELPLVAKFVLVILLMVEVVELYVQLMAKLVEMLAKMVELQLMANFKEHL